jgi:two-component system chemotaxis response regulator CheB
VSTLRVLVVEDSMTVRSLLADVLASDSDIEVVGLAGDGRQAIELCEQLRPDLVTMDMMLPVMSGLAATEYIMAYFPTPILVVSSSFNRGEVFKTFDALAAGAIDVLEKPVGDEAPGAWEARLLAAVKMVARVPVITHLRHRLGSRAGGQSHTPVPAPPAPATPALTTSVPALLGPARRTGGARPDLIAIGASTGGPSAIVEVLQHLPDAIDVPLLVVLHISEPFGEAFAEWLDGQTGRDVAYARDGQPLTQLGGRVAMAPPGRHLVVRGGRLRLSSDAERFSCRPSVDVLFESVAREHAERAVACLLTGMGRDGAAGLGEVRRAGGHTIAQDQATSVVYGMPGQAARIGAAERILPLSEIGPAIGWWIGRRQLSTAQGPGRR